MNMNKKIIFSDLPYDLKICQNSSTVDEANYQIKRGDYHITIQSNINLLTWTYQKDDIQINRTMLISDEDSPHINLTKNGIILVLHGELLKSTTLTYLDIINDDEMRDLNKLDIKLDIKIVSKFEVNIDKLLDFF